MEDGAAPVFGRPGERLDYLEGVHEFVGVVRVKERVPGGRALRVDCGEGVEHVGVGG